MESLHNVQKTSETISLKSMSKIRYILYNKWLYIFLLPAVIYFFIFLYYPTYGLVLAFKDFNFSKGILGSPWAGLKHFEMLFGAEGFRVALKNSVVLSLIRLVCGFPAPIFLALLINELRNKMFKRFAQTVVYLPHFVSWVIISGMAMSLLSTSEGLVNNFIKNIGMEAVPFLDNIKYWRFTFVGIEIWKEAGWGTIIYLAALAGIDQEQYEAAFVDGATRLQRLMYITLPGITSTIAVLLILRIGNLLKTGFEQIFLLYNPLVYDVADVLETYAYRNGILEGRFSYSTAMGLFQAIISVLLVLGANRMSKRITGNSIY